jgi:nucleotide-binding universal stress UspA family protein
MRILFAGDEHDYSEYAIKETAKLAMNTWADVTLLGVHAVQSAKESAKATVWPVDLPVSGALRRYRDLFLNSWVKEESPYEMQEGKYEWIQLNDGRWEEAKVLRGRRKDFRVRLRIGNPSSEILSEAAGDGTDLIVLGCARGDNCFWSGSRTVPQEVVNQTDCSVLLVKQDRPVTRILACLDQGYISQESLEMINQMVTIHDARLELIGLSQDGDMNKAAYTRLIEIGDYYSDRNIKIETRLTEVSDFEQFISAEIREDLVALWAGKKSLLSRFFARDWIGRFVSKCRSSVLVMR